MNRQSPKDIESVRFFSQFQQKDRLLTAKPLLLTIHLSDFLPKAPFTPFISTSLQDGDHHQKRL